MAKDNLTKTTNIDVTVREIDFVTRFNRQWDALRELMGIMRPIRKQAGTKLVTYKTRVNLEDGNVGEGEDIPYSLATVEEAGFEDIKVEKYAKAVSIEAVAKYGASVAVEKTDDEFMTQLLLKVVNKFYTFLNNGALVDTADSFQMALAMAKGNVLEKFADMDKTVTDVVGFCNIQDVYKYIGASQISVQTQFGLNYVKDFMGYSTLFLLPNKYIKSGRVIALPVENIDLYYIDPADSDFAKLGLTYTTQGETNLIGFHAQGNYGTAVGEMFALMGMTLWAEYIDGVSIVDVNSSNLTDATVTASAKQAYWGTNVSDMQDDITVADGKITGTLKKLTSGQLVTDWGEGYFIALAFDDFSSGLTYNNVKVGIVPTEGAGMQTLDSDKDAVIKVTNKAVQKIAVVQKKGANERTQYFDLSGLVLE